VFVGLAFNTKFLQAYLVLPAFAVTYIVAAPGRVRQRFVGLIVAGATVIVSSGWWVLAVQLVPASMRPYVGGSTDGTALQLLFGYDGLGRILGFGSAPSVGIAAGVGAGQGGLGGGAGANFSGIPGLLRMFNSQLGGQVAWLLPFASFAGVASIVLRIRQARTDLARAAALMWTLWLVVHVLVFSLMSGIIHSYYTVVLAPAIGALVGMASVEFWRARAEHRVLAALALAGALGGSAVLAWQLLLRTPDFVPGLAWLVLAFGSVSAFVIALGAVLPAGSWGRGRLVRRATTGAATLGLVMLLAGPAAYAADTVVTAYSGGDPAAGPSILSDGGSGFAGFPGRQFAGLPEGSLPGGFNWGGDGRPGDGDGGGGPGAAIPGRGSLNGAAVIGREALEYLVANRASAKWIVAANSADEAAPIQLATGQPVMTMGGFNGQDPAPTLEQLKQYIASGDLRFVLANTIGGFGGPSLGRDSGIATWVETNCSLVNISVSAAVRLYDCAGAS
jgi:4-amino-4-deoxy-L-arabinose transferase-like glycosyltransferase